MKKLSVLILTLFALLNSYAQQKDVANEEKGFKLNRVFMGTSLNVGLSGKSVNLGLNPEIGYSLNNWLDAGIAINLNYYSQGISNLNITNTTTKYKNFNYGGGGFLRIWPLPFLHLQIQPEHNWITSTQTNTQNDQTMHFSRNAGSLLVGIGYGSREIGSRFSHFTVMIDLMQDQYSPYRDLNKDPQPVFRGGFGIYLNAKKR